MQAGDAPALVRALGGLIRRRRDGASLADLANGISGAVKNLIPSPTAILMQLVDGEPRLVGKWPKTTVIAPSFLAVADPRWVTVSQEFVTLRTWETTATYRKVSVDGWLNWICELVTVTPAEKAA